MLGRKSHFTIERQQAKKGEIFAIKNGANSCFVLPTRFHEANGDAQAVPERI